LNLIRKEATMSADNKAFVPMMARNETLQDARIPLPDPTREPEVYEAAAKLPRNRYDRLASKVMPVVLVALLGLAVVAGLLHLQMLTTVFACAAVLGTGVTVALSQLGVEERATEIARQRLNGSQHD
jgi:hypothetical protein